MKEKNKLRFVILSLLILLLFGNNLHAEPMQATDNLRMETILLPPSAPDKGQLTLVSVIAVGPETEIIAWLAVYDDAATKRSADYLELYGNSGNLLATSWIDRFGILRIAIDRGLLQKEPSRLDGIFVLLPEGTLS